MVEKKKNEDRRRRTRIEISADQHVQEKSTVFDL